MKIYTDDGSSWSSLFPHPYLMKRVKELEASCREIIAPLPEEQRKVVEECLYVHWELLSDQMRTAYGAGLQAGERRAKRGNPFD